MVTCYHPLQNTRSVTIALKGHRSLEKGRKEYMSCLPLVLAVLQLMINSALAILMIVLIITLRNRGR